MAEYLPVYIRSESSPKITSFLRELRGVQCQKPHVLIAEVGLRTSLDNYSPSVSKALLLRGNDSDRTLRECGARVVAAPGSGISGSNRWRATLIFQVLDTRN